MKKTFSNAYRRTHKPIEYASNLISIGRFIFDISTFFVTLPATIYGLKVLSNLTFGTNGPMPLPFRFMIFVTFAAMLGWGLGWCIRQLTRDSSDAKMVFAMFVAAIWAALLVAITDTLSVTGSIFPEYLWFTIIGICIVLWLLTFQLSSQRASVSNDVVEDRASVVFVFALVAVIASLLFYIEKTVN